MLCVGTERIAVGGGPMPEHDAPDAVARRCREMVSVSTFVIDECRHERASPECNDRVTNTILRTTARVETPLCCVHPQPASKRRRAIHSPRTPVLSAAWRVPHSPAAPATFWRLGTPSPLRGARVCGHRPRSAVHLTSAVKHFTWPRAEERRVHEELRRRPAARRAGSGTPRVACPRCGRRNGR